MLTLRNFSTDDALILHQFAHPNMPIDKIEEMSQMKFGGVLFDINECDWNVNTSVFAEMIYGYSQLVFLIQDFNFNIFGAYINSAIDKYQYHQQISF